MTSHPRTRLTDAPVTSSVKVDVVDVRVSAWECVRQVWIVLVSGRSKGVQGDRQLSSREAD